MRALLLLGPWVALVALAGALLLYRQATDARLAAVEAKAAGLEDSGLTWAAVAKQAKDIAIDNVARCSWSFLPANDRDGILDAIMVGCTRSDPCKVAWTLGDEPGEEP